MIWREETASIAFLRRKHGRYVVELEFKIMSIWHAQFVSSYHAQKTEAHLFYFCGIGCEDKNLEVSSGKKIVLHLYWKQQSRKSGFKGVWLEVKKTFPEWAIKQTCRRTFCWKEFLSTIYMRHGWVRTCSSPCEFETQSLSAKAI